MSDGMSKTTLMTKLNIEKELQIVKCSVHYKGGQSAISSIAFNAACTWSEAQTFFFFLKVPFSSGSFYINI